MPRTALLQKIHRLMQAASRANRLGLGDAALHDRLAADHDRTLSRRRFLGVSAAAATLAPLAAIPAAHAATAVPIAIIGAGAAGMAAAYTLKHQRIPFILYEASNRLGGRIFTLKNFNTDNQFVELGAELVDSDHDALISLARAVMGRGAIQEFAGPDAAGADALESDLFFFGGTLHTQATFIAGLRPLLAQIERDATAIYQGLDREAAIISADWSGSNFVRDIDALSVADYLDRHRALIDPWIADAVSVAYTGDMGAETHRQSALNLVDAIDTDPDTDGFYLFGGDESKRIRGGNSGLIQALYNNVFADRDPNATLHRGHNLRAIAQNSGATRFTLNFDTAGRSREITASQVILAIPGTMLREVAGLDKLDLPPLARRHITELGFGNNSKIMLNYPDRFWRQGHNGRPPNEGAAYLDLGSQNIWETSRRQPGTQGVLTNFLGGDAGRGASDASAAKAQADLATLYGDATLRNRATKSVAWNWTNQPFTRAGYSCPAPGQFTAFWGSLAKPQLGGRLLFAGEHTSIASWGFMNGAYESGLRAARQAIAARRR